MSSMSLMRARKTVKPLNNQHTGVSMGTPVFLRMWFLKSYS
jgi:hypothetical protein